MSDEELKALKALSQADTTDKNTKLKDSMEKYSKYMLQGNTLTNFLFEPFDVFMSDDFEWKPMKDDKENK